MGIKSFRVEWDERRHTKIVAAVRAEKGRTLKSFVDAAIDEKIDRETVERRMKREAKVPAVVE